MQKTVDHNCVDQNTTRHKHVTLFKDPNTTNTTKNSKGYQRRTQHTKYILHQIVDQMHAEQNRTKYTRSKQNNMQIADTIATRGHNVPRGDGGDDQT